MEENRYLIAFLKNGLNIVIRKACPKFLTEEYARILLDAGVGYIFPAFDGATKETYEKHRVNCHFENVLNNIRRFAAMRDEGDYGTSIQVKFMRTKLNESELLQTYHIFNEFCLQSWIISKRNMLIRGMKSI